MMAWRVSTVSGSSRTYGHLRRQAPCTCGGRACCAPSPRRGRSCTSRELERRDDEAHARRQLGREPVQRVGRRRLAEQPVHVVDHDDDARGNCFFAAAARKRLRPSAGAPPTWGPPSRAAGSALSASSPAGTAGARAACSAASSPQSAGRGTRRGASSAAAGSPSSRGARSCRSPASRARRAAASCRPRSSRRSCRACCTSCRSPTRTRSRSSGSPRSLVLVLVVRHALASRGRARGGARTLRGGRRRTRGSLYSAQPRPRRGSECAGSTGLGE